MSAADRDPRVAVIDLDGTLCARDTLWPLLRAALARRPVRIVHSVVALPLVVALATRDRGRAKERLVAAALKGMPLDAAGAMAQEVAESLKLSGEVRDLVREHLAMGDRVWIASASVEPVVAAVARIVGAHGFVGTALEDDGAHLTGRFRGANCKGVEKLRRLDAVLPAGWPTRAIAYTDSASDQPLMAAVGHPCWIRRGRLRDPSPLEVRT